MVEIRLPKCRLFFTQQEIESLLKRDPELWEAALRRGKAIMRARAREARETRRKAPRSRDKRAGQGLIPERVRKAPCRASCEAIRNQRRLLEQKEQGGILHG